ncbi:hypothetical protein BDV96DRAFT_631609 [Lophiotrema nucula]|uniref:C2H2-type domain-containing protein n=1 Tax=Lophiotrema nucula TaxID=690887 RepID=A0A6A5Z904_9PLEO|nr:hypothetical protein BDV96DRAFT_631609 [Lophiotrema nucula]
MSTRLAELGQGCGASLARLNVSTEEPHSNPTHAQDSTTVPTDLDIAAESSLSASASAPNDLDYTLWLEDYDLLESDQPYSDESTNAYGFYDPQTDVQSLPSIFQLSPLQPGDSHTASPEELVLDLPENPVKLQVYSDGPFLNVCDHYDGAFRGVGSDTYTTTTVSDQSDPANALQSGLRTSQSRNQPIKQWFAQNIAAPYASGDQINQLSIATGLSPRQVRTSLSNLRARTKSSNQHVARPGAGMVPDLFKSEVCSTTESYPCEVLPEPPHPEGVPPLFDLDLNLYSLLDSDGLSSGDGSDLTTYGLPSPPYPQHPDRSPTIHRRKGKRQYASSYELNIRRPSINAANGPTADDRYPCTVCLKPFKTPYEWKRHESVVHDYHVRDWICMLDGALTQKDCCVFCSATVTTADHFEQHGTSKCLVKDIGERTFGRKDLLKQHVRQVHIAETNPVARKAFKIPDTWARDVGAGCCNPSALWCGFCFRSLDSPAKRMDHVAEHFRNGFKMDKWISLPG